MTSKRECSCHLQQKSPIVAAHQPADEGMPLRPSTNRWFAERYNVNNAWIFNGNNGILNNNNVNNGNRAQAVANLHNPYLKRKT